MANRQGEGKLLIQRSKSTYSLSKLRGLPQPFNLMKQLKIPPFLKHSTIRWANIIFIKSLQRVCKWPGKLCMVNGRDITELSN